MNSATANLINTLSSLNTESSQHLINLLQSGSGSVPQRPSTPPTNYLQPSFPCNNLSVQQNMFQMLNTFVPHSIPNIAPNPNHNTMNSCPNVKQCASIKRIVKLDVFHTKYGAHNTALISQFMCASTEFNDLTTDYQHSIQCHSGHSDQHKITQMSRDYQNIFDFIGNFRHKNGGASHSNVDLSYPNFQFYNQKMDAIYEGMNTSTNPNIYTTDAIAQSETSIAKKATCSMESSYTSSPIHTPPMDIQRPLLDIQPSSIVLLQPTRRHAPIPPTTRMSSMNPNEPPPLQPLQSMDSIELQRRTKNQRVQKMNEKIQMTAEPKPVPQRRYQCVLCHKSYKHLCNWRSHSKVHTDQAFICPHCGKRFGRKANYKEHLRIHTGESPYACELCQKKFKHHHSWKDHMRIHTGITPYQCNICNKKFTVSHNLTVHRRIHTGEKPYQCKICLKTFRQKSAINSHLKRNHNNE